MKKLMNLLLLSCRKATELIEKRKIVPLSTIEKIQLSIHASMCKACKSYNEQSDTIDKAFAHWTENENKKELGSVSPEMKSHILYKLKEK